MLKNNLNYLPLIVAHSTDLVRVPENLPWRLKFKLDQQTNKSTYPSSLSLLVFVGLETDLTSGLRGGLSVAVGLSTDSGY
jgi:hypothetical protein